MSAEYTITGTGLAGSTHTVLQILCGAAPSDDLVATYYHADADDTPCERASFDEEWRKERVVQQLEHAFDHPLAPKNGWWPNIPSEVFHGAAYITWEGLWYVDEIGEWSLRAEVYDALRIDLDGQTILVTKNCGAKYIQIGRDLTFQEQKYHSIKIVYYTNNDPFMLSLTVKKPSSDAFVSIPKGMFFHYPAAPFTPTATLHRFTQGESIQPISFRYFAVDASSPQITIDPPLPEGLRLSEGVVEGTPSVFNETTFTVTAKTGETKLTTSFVLSSRSVAPPETIEVVNEKGESVTSVSLSVYQEMAPLRIKHDDTAMVTITPALPEGIEYDQAKDVIQGTPTVTMEATAFTVEAATQGGTKRTVLTLEVPRCAFGSYFYIFGNTGTYDIQIEKDGVVAFEQRDAEAGPHGSVFCIRPDTYSFHLFSHKDHGLYYVVVYREDKTQYFKKSLQAGTWFNTTLEMVPKTKPYLSFNYTTISALVKEQIKQSYEIGGIYGPIFTEPALPEGSEINELDHTITVTFRKRGIFAFSVSTKNDAGTTTVVLHFNVDMCPPDYTLYYGTHDNNGLTDRLNLYLESTGELVVSRTGDSISANGFMLCLLNEAYIAEMVSGAGKDGYDRFFYLRDANEKVVHTFIFVNETYKERVMPVQLFRADDEKRVWKSKRAVAKQWKQAGFNDRKWAASRDYALGTFSEGNTVYLRYRVSLTAEQVLPMVSVEIKANGGFILYVNEGEALRVNLPRGYVTGMAAERVVAMDNWTSFDLNGELFHAGSNLIAVEYHSYDESDQIAFAMQSVQFTSRSRFMSYEGVATGSAHIGSNKPEDAFFGVNDYAYWEDDAFPAWLRFTFPNEQRRFVNRMRIRASKVFVNQPTFFSVVGVHTGVVEKEGKRVAGEIRDTLAVVNDPLFFDGPCDQIDVPLRAQIAYSAIEIVVQGAASASDTVRVNNVRLYTDYHMFCEGDKKWPRAIADSVVYGKCPFLTIGQSTRTCASVENKPVWSDVDQSTCLTRRAGKEEAFIDLGYRLYNCSMKYWKRSVEEALTLVIVREITVKEEDVHFYLSHDCSEEGDLPSVCVQLRLRPHRLASQYVKMQLVLFNANASALFYRKSIADVPEGIQILQSEKIRIHEQWSEKDITLSVVILVLAVMCIVLFTLYCKSATLGREKTRKRLSKKAIPLSRMKETEKEGLLNGSDI